MQEIIKLLIGVLVLIFGFPIGNFLARVAKDELKQGKKWFKLIVILSLFSGLIGLVISNDALMFTFFFIAIITSRSLRK